MTQPRQDSPTTHPMAVLAGVVLVLYFAREVLIPLALAITLNFLLSPMVEWFQKVPMRRMPAVVLTVVISIVALGSMGWVVATQLLQVANDLPQYRLNIHDKIEALHYPPDSALGRAAKSVEEIGDEFSDSGATATANPQANPQNKPGSPTVGPQLPSAVRPVPVQVIAAPPNSLRHLGAMVGSAIRPVALTVMVFIFTVFILIKQRDLRDRLLRLGGLAQLHAMTLALDDAARRISRYLVMQVLVNAGYGLCFGLGLFAIGIPNATLWGVIAGLLRIVPYAGALAATGFPLVLSLAAFHGWGPPLLVCGLYCVLELITANIVEPLLYGAHTGISSLALLVTTVFWTTLWGWAGLVLAVPLTVCVIVLGRYMPRMSFLHVLLGDETALSLEARFYQRLLALDQDDARSIARKFLKTNSLQVLYDQVLVPALTLAENDRHKGALDSTRESYVFLSMSEIVSELSTVRQWRVSAGAQAKAKSKSRWRTTTQSDFFVMEKPDPSDVRVFCLSANDQADEISASMLSQLLERAGHGVLSLPVGAPFEEILTHIPPEPQDVICISALPPFAFSQAAALCQRIRIQLPEIKILAGVWGFDGDLEEAKERFGSTEPDRLVSSLGQAVEQIGLWRGESVAK